METVEVNGMRVSAAVDEMKTQQIAFAASESGAWNLAIIRPGREEYTGGNFDVLFECHHFPFANGLTRFGD